MKSAQLKPILFLLSLLLGSPSIFADTNRTFAVILPESVDGLWYWYSTPTKQHVVQTQVEKYLLRAGHQVKSVENSDALQSLFKGHTLATQEAMNEKAQAAGVTHIISGVATAAGTDRTTAYGVPVYRSSAQISARITEAATGNIVAVEIIEAIEGGQGYVEASKTALHTGGKSMGEALLKAIRKLDQDK